VDIIFIQPAARDGLFDAQCASLHCSSRACGRYRGRIFGLRKPYCLADLARVFQRYYFYIFLNAFRCHERATRA
jgi:hypothetical protein